VINCLQCPDCVGGAFGAKRKKRRFHELIVDGQMLNGIVQVELSMFFGSLCMVENVSLLEKDVSVSASRRPPVPDAAMVGL
jgi:hypothetical protein